MSAVRQIDPSESIVRMRDTAPATRVPCHRARLMETRMPLPELDPESRRQALQKAAEARKVRAELKQQLKAGEIDFAEVLRRAEDDEIIGKTKVSAVLEALPKVGKVRARKLMERLDISPSRRVRGLGQNQREKLLREFEADAGAG